MAPHRHTGSWRGRELTLGKRQPECTYRARSETLAQPPTRAQSPPPPPQPPPPLRGAESPDGGARSSPQRDFGERLGLGLLGSIGLYSPSQDRGPRLRVGPERQIQRRRIPAAPDDALHEKRVPRGLEAQLEASVQRTGDVGGKYRFTVDTFDATAGLCVLSLVGVAAHREVLRRQ